MTLDEESIEASDEDENISRYVYKRYIKRRKIVLGRDRIIFKFEEMKWERV